MKSGKTEAESVRVVERAIDLGINLIDTSGRNGTEGIIGRAVSSYDRSRLVLSTKALVSEGNSLQTAAQFSTSIERSLRDLGTNYVDIMHFHGVLPHEYEYAVTELLPVMEKFQAAGKIRFIGITEQFERDRDHIMLQRALDDDCWDSMMAGFNIVNQSARASVFTPARDKDVGVLGMFAVRRALTTSECFRQALAEIRSDGQLAPDFDIDNVVAELTEEQPIANIAYRYCRDEAGIHSVLTGTGDIRHLEQNYTTFDQPPLTESTRRLIDTTFAHVTNFSGN